MSTTNGKVCLARESLHTGFDDCEDEEDPCQPYTTLSNGGGGGPVQSVTPWPRQDGSRLAIGRLKAKLFETRLAAHVRRAQLALTDSLKHAGWAVEHKVSEVSRRGWNEATRAWGSSGGSGGGTLALTGGSGGPHERSSLLLGPGDGYQRLDNNSSSGPNTTPGQTDCLQQDSTRVKDDNGGEVTNSWDSWEEEEEGDKNNLESSDGWGEDGWASDWGKSNTSKATSPNSHSPAASPSPPATKRDMNSITKKNKGSKQAEQQLLVDVENSSSGGGGGGGGGGSGKGHTWDNWDDDWEKLDTQ